MNIPRRYIPMCCLAVLAAACTVDQEAPPETTESYQTRSAATSACMGDCVNQAMKQYPKKYCLKQCTQKRSRLKLGPKGCDKKCEKARKARQRFVELQCKSTCLNDKDSDGVADQLDRCPGTKPTAPTTWRGCRDGDQDGIDDGADHCPNTVAGTPIDTDGCALPPECADGRCGNYYPRCEAQSDCDRSSEISLPAHVSRKRRAAVIDRMLKRKYADVACPTDHTAPPQPRLIWPAKSIEHRRVGNAGVNFADGEVVDGTQVSLNFQWTPVTDACPPVEYSLYLEAYYCDGIDGVDEPVRYYNTGWCRWTPLLYKSTSQTSYQFEFEFGKHLYDIYQPFADHLSWDPPENGPMGINYRPFWIRTSIIAHDANARASAFKNHESHRYIVLFSKAPLDALRHIPVAP